MAIFHQLLCLLIVVRVMFPPGVCTCQRSSPPAHEHEHHQHDDEQHHSGCPSSPLTTGLGLKPLAGPWHAVALIGPSLDLAPGTLTLTPFHEVAPWPEASLPDAHLYLTQCSILI